MRLGILREDVPDYCEDDDAHDCHAFEEATGKKVPYKIVERRPGDIATCYADATKAKEILGWQAEYGMVDMCRDADNWQTKNPNGYGE